MKKNMPANVPARTSSGGAAPSIIGADVVMEGNLTSDNEVHLEGTVEGNVKCGSLVMGESGSVTGNIFANQVTIRGHVKGDIRAQIVHLEKSSVINGNVYHESLTVEAGAKLNGQFSHGPASDFDKNKDYPAEISDKIIKAK